MLHSWAPFAPVPYPCGQGSQEDRADFGNPLPLFQAAAAGSHCSLGSWQKPEGPTILDQAQESDGFAGTMHRPEKGAHFKMNVLNP